jgi:hypothetical protein
MIFKCHVCNVNGVLVRSGIPGDHGPAANFLCESCSHRQENRTYEIGIYRSPRKTCRTCKQEDFCKSDDPDTGCQEYEAQSLTAEDSPGTGLQDKEPKPRPVRKITW